MMYDERFITPMRQELTRIGFSEMRTASEVDERLTGSAGTTLVVVNSMCGCAARNARPGVALALEQASARPDALTTVFAGQDPEATERARSYITPSIALLKNGQPVFMLERWQIEGRPATAIAADLAAAFDEHCVVATNA